MHTIIIGRQKREKKIGKRIKFYRNLKFFSLGQKKLGLW